MKIVFFFLTILLVSTAQSDQPVTPPEEVEVIIFVHGTIKPPEISFSNLYKIINDNVDDTILSMATEHVRKNPFFYRGQPIQEIGLKPIVVTLPIPEGVPTRTAQTIAEIYDFQYSLAGKSTPKKLYYTFGWNGLLSVRKRYQAAQELYYTLQSEIKKLQGQNLNPKITIITYSHGGNVVLYLPTAHAEQQTHYRQVEPFAVDTLIMLACPIQKETDFLVEDPLFKKVYNIFSTEDYVQQWDFFSGHEQFFSQRIFKNRRTFAVPKKIVQVRVRATKKVRGISPEKVEDDVEALLSHPSKYFEHRDPGHMEIGGFSWGNYWYRDTFPLFPLPVIALVPTIINTLETLFPTTTLATFDFVPQYNTALVIDDHTKQKKLQVLWTPEERIKLWDNLCTNVPLDYTFYNQETHYAQALRSAHETLLKTKNGRKYRYPHNKTLARLLQKASPHPAADRLIIADSRHKPHKHYRFTRHTHHHRIT